MVGDWVRGQSVLQEKTVSQKNHFNLYLIPLLQTTSCFKTQESKQAFIKKKKKKGNVFFQNARTKRKEWYLKPKLVGRSGSHL
jgi:hypothetical protein